MRMQRLLSALLMLILLLTACAAQAPATPELINIQTPSLGATSVPSAPVVSPPIVSSAKPLEESLLPSATLETARQTKMPDPERTPVPYETEETADTVNIVEIESTETMREQKKALQKVVDELKILTPGLDYAENKVIALVPDHMTAQAVADQYHMKLNHFEDGLADYETTEPVLSMIQKASDINNVLYPIYPDYLRSIS